MNFDYNTAFSRNLGIFTPAEQDKISQFKVGLAGMGGVGGEYLIALVRMGFQNFKICDIDEFELANFNRQFGANMETVGKLKTETMKNIAFTVNPNCQIEIFDEPISQSNAQAFVKDCDLIIDGMDFFALNAHETLIQEALKQQIPVIAAVPFGLGAGYIAFTPQGCDFKQYFRFSLAKDEHEKAILFALGFGIGAYHIHYLQPEYVKIQQKSGPSHIAGIKACSGLISAGTCQALLWPDELKPAPWATHVDFRRRQSKTKYITGGNGHWLQRLKFKIAKNKFL